MSHVSCFRMWVTCGADSSNSDGRPRLPLVHLTLSEGDAIAFENLAANVSSDFL